jgi:single-strand DNA-binding protein
MSDYNKWIGIGRLLDNPKLSYTPKGTPVASFKMANNVGYGDFKRTNFIPGKIYGKKAEIFVKYATKGRRVFIDGEVQWLSGKNDDGTYWNFTAVVVNDFIFVDSQNGNNTVADEIAGKTTPPDLQKSPAGPEDIPDNPYADGGVVDDSEDIPF